MGRVVYVEESGVEWRVSPPKPGMPVDNPGVRAKFLTAGSDEIPRVLLAEYEAGHTEPRHKHREAELLYVLDGEATIEATTIRPGMLVYVEGSTEYGPVVSGPAGIRFLRIEVR